ncbi:M48 family metalloprotease [Emticicia soli]|uniref:Peptidase M48 domain-containing protein n=1 Tax=Emticicia soli TaxID=2027878 RepID=A0ABW5J503_9BACT
MKQIILFVILVFVFTNSFAQNKKNTKEDEKIARKCHCGDVKGKSFEDEKDMFDSATEARAVVKSFRSFFPDFNEDIRVMPVTCLENGNPAKAIVCTKIRYVFYDNDNLTKEKNSWFDKFVLAHELGHHIRGHFHDGSTFNPKTGDTEEYNNKNFKFYNESIIEELQADELAVYTIKRLGGNLSTISKAMEARGEPASNKHPSSKERSLFIEACWKRLNVNRDFDKQNDKNFATEFHIKYGKKVYGFTFEVLGGWMTSIPQFSKNNETVNATLISRPNKPTFKAGLRFSYINIDFPIRPEVEVNFLSHHYATLDEAKISKAEEFSFQHISIIPQATFSTLSISKDSITIPRWAFTASAGLAVNVPVAYSYSNYYTANTPAMSKSDLKTTFNPTFAIGLERKPIRDKIVKYFRVSARYSPMPLGIPSNNPQDKLSTKSHLMDLSLSLRLWN